jgi:lysyl-tRNA synthetase class 2
VPYIESTAVRRIEYDGLSRGLVVVFTTGRRYTYYDVPRDVYQDFIDAQSQGQYFNARIRDRYQYPED